MKRQRNALILITSSFFLNCFFQNIFCMNIETTTNNHKILSRAVRPDAQNPKDADAVVGPDKQDSTLISVCCDRLLRRLGTVHEGPCSDSVLGILGDACEILGRDATISGTLLDLCIEFSLVSTRRMITMDFDAVFTIIDGIEESLCNKFEGVFTSIDEINDGFNGVFTSLDNICNKLEELSGTIMIDIDLNTIFTVIGDIEETLCDKFEGVFSVLDEILEDEVEGFNGIFTVLDRLCEKIEDVTASIVLQLQIDINAVFTAIDGFEELLCDKFEGVFTELNALTLCDPVPLTQDDVDVVSGAISLDIEGINYCMAENITGDIEISGNNVNLDMNNRVLFGVVNVNADEITVENGKIRPPAPTSNIEAFSRPGVSIGSENTVLRDLLIVCDDTVVADVMGRGGIDNNGDKTQIIDCSITSGSAGPIVVFTRTGGVGIVNTGDNILIANCIIETGNGGAATGPLTVGGNGGDGIQSDHRFGFCKIDNCFIKTGRVGQATLRGGRAGHGIVGTAGSFFITDCKIVPGPGGPQGFFPNPFGDSGDGGIFSVDVEDVIIDKCIIETSEGIFRANSGIGLVYQGDGLFKVTRSCITTGFGTSTPLGIRALSTLCNELSDLTIKTGEVVSSAAGFAADSSGVGISIGGPGVIKRCSISTGNVTASSQTSDPVLNSGAGIQIIANTGTVDIGDCKLVIGRGGVHMAGPGGNSGSGIEILTNPDAVAIEGCVIKIARPGTGTLGNGTRGNGIDMVSNNWVSISDTVVQEALNGFDMLNSSFCIVNSKSFRCTNAGFSVVDTGTAQLIGVIRDSIALEGSADGFFINSNAMGVQLLSNKALKNGGIGFNNTSISPATISIYNNVASENAGGNFVGVANVEATPMADTRFYANVIA